MCEDSLWSDYDDEYDGVACAEEYKEQLDEDLLDTLNTLAILLRELK